MEEVRKRVERAKEKIKQIGREIHQFDLKKSVEKFFLENGKEKQLSDMLFLVQYSLKYKNVCKWPNYNDLLVINYNINDHFKSMLQKNGRFVQQYKNGTPDGGTDSTTTMSRDRETALGSSDKSATINHNVEGNAPQTAQKEIDANSQNGMASNIKNSRSSEDREEQIFPDGTHLTKGELPHNFLPDNSVPKSLTSKEFTPQSTPPENSARRKKENKFVTYFNEDISPYDKIKLQIFMYFVLNNYRVKILVDALSALNRPINVIYINCPNNKEQKRTFFEKVASFFTPQYKLGDVFVNNKNNYVPKSKENCSCSELSPIRYSNNPTTSSSKDGNSNYVGGYNPINNTIWICSNNIKNYYKLKYILTHELIHAFDFARANIDMYNCHHIACSEIRAYNMSNQCSYFNSKYFSPDHDVFTNFKTPSIRATPKNKCIYNNVYSSLNQYKPCTNNTHQYINEVFEKCLHDYWPFMCSPEQDSKYKPSKIFKKDF
ncbi:metalloprotease, putative [Plasmodium knowlesi strain H]|uniref:Metalloprotease, putative n=3 Tax=Plasmodium knowlesi TaxID=5850 RepID=A0A5K1UJD8_PLAKH|nr:mitochondrial inner membrane protease ATP23, putative [Plasmodium knowlesi strain H]OTN65330.1 putative Metalloprotease [Plasmodium knowlesi]CAA9989733.1 mitochondrial inner membrane protease ATP23, putative [Plasmodium knowlesi strain H]SBO22887.1 metalloprotease, putative [Plasmodium knowlesi strain H]SBO23014.1 metalloprotease, putative [Plasmodium knowlesi strain H]VVS79207.1 mitochondrial inner membrane protease ATP23, putative [Plasmodium knowlesi strain H]|eukprot:XP_002260456.1 hypothetical protein, conserved in Plasmodium species [Plasmodium knowlesi strain H]